MRPLSRQWGMQRRWADGRDMETVAAEFVKPNDRLTSFERLELYNKQYWFRLVDCMYEDYPGLCAILGDRKFNKLLQAYLTVYPSRSTLLRNLGDKLEQFLTDEPQWAAPHQKMSLDMAKFEWAQVAAFDASEKKPLTPDDLLGKDPAKLRLGVQPHITFLELRYPLDEFVIAMKKEGLRGEASNATDGFVHKSRRAKPPKPGKTFVAVHRQNNSVFLKRLEKDHYTILTSLRDGATVGEAVARAIETSRRSKAGWPARIKEWFQQWMELGWFCRR